MAAGVRRFLTVNGLRLSYIDFEGSGKPILALHGHYSNGRTFSGLADALRGKWHVIALDQRGHGWSDKPDDYSREAYVSDIEAVMEKLGIAPGVVLGHSLGGLNAYQLAAHRPDLVGALVVEDIGIEIPALPIPTDGWPERFDSLRAMSDWFAARGQAIDPYFLESVAEYPDGWGFRFDYGQLKRSMQLLQGDWRVDWLASKCPALLLHGHKSWVLSTGHAREMARIRPNARLVEFPGCGHTIHDDEPQGYYGAVGEFLSSLGYP